MRVLRWILLLLMIHWLVGCESTDTIDSAVKNHCVNSANKLSIELNHIEGITLGLDEVRLALKRAQSYAIEAESHCVKVKGANERIKQALFHIYVCKSKQTDFEKAKLVYSSMTTDEQAQVSVMHDRYTRMTQFDSGDFDLADFICGYSMFELDRMEKLEKMMRSNSIELAGLKEGFEKLLSKVI